jgi:hypothetical protein
MRRRVDGGRRLLRAVAAAAAALWLVAVVATALSTWHTLDVQNAPAVDIPNIIEQNPKLDGWSVIRVVETSLEASWGYAIVAALAFAASTYFDDARARDLFEQLDDLEDANEDR